MWVFLVVVGGVKIWTCVFTFSSLQRDSPPLRKVAKHFAAHQAEYFLRLKLCQQVLAFSGSESPECVCELLLFAYQ